MAKALEPAEQETEQEYLAGMAPKRIEAVHRAALKVAKYKREKKQLGELEKDAEALLIQAMKKHNVNHYSYGSVTVSLEALDKATVKVKRQGGEDSEEEE